MTRWVKGKRALKTCSRCGFVYLNNQLKKELTGLLVCQECHDGKFQITNHPLNFPAPFRPDAPLKDPRPDARLDVPTSLAYNTYGDDPWQER